MTSAPVQSLPQPEPLVCREDGSSFVLLLSHRRDGSMGRSVSPSFGQQLGNTSSHATRFSHAD